jgi:predicted TPR repeat methyltransferase
MKSRRAPAVKSNENLFAEAIEAQRSGQVARAKTAFHTLLKRAPNHLDGHFLLGTLYAESGDYPQAVRHLGRAAELSPRSARVWNNLATTHRIAGGKAAALAAYLRALACEPDMPEAGRNLGGLLDQDESFRVSLPPALHFQALMALGQFHQLRGETDPALAAFRRAAVLQPSSSSAAFHVAALEGRPMPRRPSGDVRALFDGYAEIFEEHLVDHLGYRIPEQIAALLAEMDGGQVRYRHALDLGCGTGLSGIAVRARTEHLIGVDVSPQMLAKAGATGAYDVTAEQDLYDFLSAGDSRHDLIIAADVLVYIGALEELLAAIRRRAAAGALLWMSVELNNGPEDYRVGVEDRYLHSRGYVLRVAASTGWTVLLEHEIALRKSGEDESRGEIVALRAA